MPYSNLDHKEILQELLTWEHIESADSPSNKPEQEEGSDDAETTITDASSSDPSHLLSKFDKYMQEKEDQNAAKHDRIKQVKSTQFKSKKKAQAALDACQ